MTDFKKQDKIKIVNTGAPWENKTGVILDISDDENILSDGTNLTEVKVRVNISDSRSTIQYFTIDELEKIESESLNEGDSNMKQTKIVKEDLSMWLSDQDASYWTQEINEDLSVPIRNADGKIIGDYSFKTELFTPVSGNLNESLYDTDTIPSIEGEHNEDVIPDLDVDSDDFIHDYVYDVDAIDNKQTIASWEFASKIAIGENLSEEQVIAEAMNRKYKLFCIQGLNYEKIVVAAKGIKKDNIYADYADYLEGNVKVIELN